MHQKQLFSKKSIIAILSAQLLLAGCAVQHHGKTKPAPAPEQAPSSAQEFETVKNFKTFKNCPDKQQLEAHINHAKETVERYQGGHVIVGRVVLDGPGDVRDVISQMEILPDGCFAGETKDLIRPVGFRMHQYAPYDLQLISKQGFFVDVGTIHMKPLKKSQLVGLEGKVVLEAGGDPCSAVVLLTVQDGPVNTPHNGTSPRSYWPEPIKIHADKNGFIKASGFSPIKYFSQVTAPDYLKKTMYLEFKPGQTFDFGTVTLEKPKQIKISYIVSEQPPFDLKDLQTVTIPAGTQWKPADDQRCEFDLEFTQNKGIVRMQYFYAPCYIWDLGPGEISDFVKINQNQPREKQYRNLRVENQHVYLMHQESLRHWLLFRTDIEGEPAPKKEAEFKIQPNRPQMPPTEKQVELILIYCQIANTALDKMDFNGISETSAESTIKILSLLSDPNSSRILFEPSLTAADGRPMSMKFNSIEFDATARIQPAGRILLDLNWQSSDPNSGHQNIKTSVLLIPDQPLILSSRRSADFTYLLFASAEIIVPEE